jgi:hypothetical protein
VRIGVAMSYVEKTLASGETVVHEAEFHWLHSLAAVLLLVIGGLPIVVSWLWWWLSSPIFGPSHMIVLVVVVLFGPVLLAGLSMLIKMWTTEIVVTSRRLVYKRGWIARYTEEFGLW